MSRLATRVGLLLAMSLSAGAVAIGARAPVEAAIPDRAHRVAVFSDSVGLGARTQIPAAFGDGWYVHVDGQPARFVEQMESQYVRPRLATNPDWFGDHVVIAAGYNAPYWDWDRFDHSIDSMIDTLTAAGVKHIHWVTLREVTYANTPAAGRSQIELYGFYFPIVNQHLEAALGRHPNLTLVDWSAVGGQLGLTYDAIHLNNTGAALYADLIRRSVLSTATRLPDQAVTTVGVPGGAGAGAAFVNLTTVDPRTAGYLAPAGTGCADANVSVHNYVRAETVAHSAIVPLAPDGSLCVRNRAATNMVVDTGGVFPAGAGFVPLTPQRWADTRAGAPVPAGGELRLAVTGLSLALPAADVTALALSVTAVDASGAGWLRVLPCGTTSSTSNVNYLGRAATPNLVVAAPGASGDVCITSSADTHVVVDAFGVFTDAAGVVPLSARAFDSRAAGAPVPARSVTRIALDDVLPIPTEPTLPGGDPVEAPDVEGVVLNLTAVDAQGAGYLTVYPCAAGRPNASNLNVANHLPVSNAAIVAPDADAAICVFNLMPTHLIVDVQATIGTAFAGRTPERLLDTRAG